MKKATTYFCTECGSESPKWAGKCPVCGAWNCLVEQKIDRAKTKTSVSAKTVKAYHITELDEEEEIRFPTGMGELDRVLGGGAVKGSLVLVGGAPGIGNLPDLRQNLSGSLCVGRRIRTSAENACQTASCEYGSSSNSV